MTTPPEQLAETWSEAQARKIRERAALEAERGQIGAKVNALRARKRQLTEAIKAGNRRRQDVAELREELSALEPDLADALEQAAGVDGDLARITADPVDGLPALLERHRPELQDISRQASADAASALAGVTAGFRHFLDLYARAQSASREAFAIGGPGHPGHRADELRDARVPGCSPLDVVAVELGDRPFVGARVAPAGFTWLRPFDVIAKLLEAVDGCDCLPAAAVTDPRQGREGIYRRVSDAQRILVDELALRRQYGEAVAGEDGFAALRYDRPLGEGERQALAVSRAEHEAWSRGEPNLNPIQGSPGGMPDAPAVDVPNVPPDIPADLERLSGVPGPTDRDVIYSRGQSSLGPHQRHGYPDAPDA